MTGRHCAVASCPCVVMAGAALVMLAALVAGTAAGVDPPAAASSDFPIAVGCLRKDYYEEYASQVLETLLTLHQDPQGKQILTLFRKSRLIPYEEQPLEIVKALINEHSELSMRLVEGK